MSRKLFKEKKEKIIAVCIAGIDEHSQIDYIHAVGVMAEKYHAKLLFFTSFSSVCMAEKYFDGEMSVYTLINYNMLDAIILFAETIKNDEIRQQIVNAAREAEVPVLTIDHALEGCYNIVFDYRSAMEQLVRHVVEEHDFDRIEYIGGMPNNSASEERLDIFKKVMRENGREVSDSQIHYGYFWAGPTEDVMKEMCTRSREEMPDAIICGNDAMAIVVCRMLKEYGYQVPEDIAVTGFDGIREAMDHTPTLTTATLNYWAVVEKAFQLIMEIGEGKEIPKDYQIDFEVIYGESCGCKSDFTHKDSGELVQQLYDRISRNHIHSNRMSSMSAMMSDSVSLDDAVEKIKPYMDLDLPASSAWVCIVDPYIMGIRELENGCHAGLLNDACFTDRIRCLIQKSPDGYIHNQFCSLHDILPEMEQVLDYAPELMIMPLHVQEKLIGYMVIKFQAWQNDYYHLQNFVNSLSVVLERLKYQLEQTELLDSLREKSMKDPLTAIFNRRGFFENLGQMYARAMESKEVLSVISLDMDGLKKINDTFGHAVGDIAIIEMAQMLERVCGSWLICSRIGGDEFTAAGIVPQDILDSFEGRMRQELDEYNARPGRQYQMDFSVGMFSGKPADGIPMDDFIRFADEKMYDQKEYHHKLTGYTR